MKYIIRMVMVAMIGCCTVKPDIGSDIGILENEHIPGKSSRLQIVSLENNTESLEFQIFPALKQSAGLSLPMETLYLADDKGQGVDLDRMYPLVIKCSKGSYRSVFIKDGHAVSGKAPEGYDGPYCVSMWLPYPYVAQSSKLHIPYVVKEGKQGKISVKIGPKGDYRLAAVSDVKFLH